MVAKAVGAFVKVTPRATTVMATVDGWLQYWKSCFQSRYNT